YKDLGVIRGKYGAFAWPIQWKLDPASNKKVGGYIIQKLTVTFDLSSTLKGGGKTERHPGNDKKWDYYEAWRVEPGKTAPERGGGPGQIDAIMQLLGAVDPTMRADTEDLLKKAKKVADADDTYAMVGGFSNTQGSVLFTGMAAYYDCVKEGFLK